MGIVDLRTNLKSLRYGKDTVGGGNSGQPFVTRAIPDDLSDVGRTGGPDFLLRGGSLLPRIVLNDATRISKLFYPGRGNEINTTNSDDPLGIDASNNGRRPVNLIGTLFTAKQNILSLTNVNSSAGYEPFVQAERDKNGNFFQRAGSAINTFLQNSVALNQGIYTPLSTIGQTVGGALGVHLNKQGLNPLTQTTIGSPDGNTVLGLPTYLNTIATNGDEGNKSRLLPLLSKIDSNTGADQTLYRYSGGPGATLGVGQTNIMMQSEYRTGINNPLSLRNKPQVTWSVGDTSTQFSPNGQFASNFNSNLPSSTPSISNTFGRGKTSYTLGSINNSPTVAASALDPILNDLLINDQFLRIGASAAYLGNTFILSGDIDAAKDGFLDSGTAKTFSIYDSNNDRFSLETSGIKEEFKSGVLKSVPRQVWTQQEIAQKQPFSKTGKTDDIKDFRKVVAPKGSNTIPDTLPYTPGNKFEKRVNLGNPGIVANRNSYTIGRRDLNNDPLRNSVEGNATYKHALDKVNALPIYQSSKVVQGDASKNDFVKFRIGVIDNDNPDKKTFIHFRAIIDSMQDNYSSEWAANKYMGRGEKFYKYQGFDRTISLNWTVAAQSKQELIPMYQKLNYLASANAPFYSKTGYMGGNLISLTIGGWCYEQVGVMNGLTLSVPEESPWDISIPDNAVDERFSSDDAKILTDPSVKELPMIVKVTGFTFNPIHNFVPSIQRNGFAGGAKFGSNAKFASSYGSQRYIALANGSSNNYSGGVKVKGDDHINYLPKP